MSDFAIGCICLTIIAVVAAFALHLDNRRAERRGLTAAPALGPDPDSRATAPRSLGTRLRKAAPYLLFVGLGGLTLTGPLWFTPVVNGVYQAATPKPQALEIPAHTALLAAAGDTAAWRMVEAIRAHNAALENATGAQNAAGQQASGWVPSATVGSKFFTAAGVLILFVILIWRLQNLTHPEPSRWAKHDYTTDWQQLTVAEKFEAYGRIRLQYVILAVGAMLFAALVV